MRGLPGDPRVSEDTVEEDEVRRGHATLALWLANFIVTQTFPSLRDPKVVGSAKTFWIHAAMSLASTIFVILVVPEPKCWTFEEIEASWTRRPRRAASLTGRVPDEGCRAYPLTDHRARNMMV